MTILNLIGVTATLSALLIQLVVFLRWIHRRMRDDEIMRAFVKDMATVQLPYMHRVLRATAEAAGVEIPDPPQIQYIELNGRPRRRDYGFGEKGHW